MLRNSTHIFSGKALAHGAGALSRMAAAMRERMSPGIFVLMLAVFIGLVTGTMAVVLKWLVNYIVAKLTGGLHGASWLYLLLPGAGIFLSVLFQRYVVRNRIEHGTEEIKADIADKNYWLRPYFLYAPMLASALTLGFGGSAGSEGPIAGTGAAVGSNVGRIFRLPPEMAMMMVALGAGAGIAGIFKSPVGGVLFTIEILRVQLSTMLVVGLFASCIVAAMTAYLWSGCTPDVAFIPTESFEPSIIPAILLLGVFCGLYGTYYRYTVQRTRRMLEAMRNHWWRNLTAAIGLGVIVFLFPVLYGEGYGIIGSVINERAPDLLRNSLFSSAQAHVWMMPVFLAGVLLLKGIAATLTNSGGGVAGDFAPTLFAGCIAGFFFATLANHFSAGLDQQVFALAGMAGTMSAIMRAPLMAVFITAEMTWNYEFFLPLALASGVAYLISRLIIKPSE